MAVKITMPKLSDTMKEGKLIKWMKNEGDDVKPGDILAEIETDKANMDLEVFDKGTLLKQTVPAGGRVPVGSVLAVIGDKKENIETILKDIEVPSPAPAPETKVVSAPTTQSPPATPAIPYSQSAAVATPPAVFSDAPAPLASSPSPAGVRVSPVAARMAAERGIALETVRGSGPGGRIVKSDIETAIGQGWSTARLPSRSSAGRPAVRIENQLTESLVPLEGMRKVIAERMSQAKQTIPHFYLQDSIHMDKVHAVRESLNAGAAVRMSFNDFVMVAVCRALMSNPSMNATFDGVGIHMHSAVDLAFAVSVEGGLITPVIRSCERLSLPQVHDAADELAARARGRKLKPDEYMGGSFTVSNLGMYGIDNFLPIINPPQVAILAVGAVKLQACVDAAGHSYAGRVMGVTIACDHRAVDGAAGAKILGDLRAALENPEGWSA